MSFAHSGKSLHVLFSPQMGHIPSLHHILARNSSCASVLFPENSHLDYFMLIEQFRALLILIVQTYDIHLFYAVRQKWSFQSLWPLGNFLCRTPLCGKAAEGCPLEQNHSLSAPPALIPCRCNCTGTEVMVFDLFQGAGKMQPSSQREELLQDTFSCHQQGTEWLLVMLDGRRCALRGFGRWSIS